MPEWFKGPVLKNNMLRAPRGTARTQFKDFKALHLATLRWNDCGAWRGMPFGTKLGTKRKPGAKAGPISGRSNPVYSAALAGIN